MPPPRILLCTVGTGNLDQLEATLLVPLSKSIRDGEWSRVILLPSQITADNAAILRDRIADVAIEISPLPGPGLENNADACFAHFDSELSKLRAVGISADDILVDFTRGTKAMSAALVLAAVAHGLPRVRYILSEQRDGRGMVVPGTEVVGNFDTRAASARQRLDEALHLFSRGDFAAVLDLFALVDGVQTSDRWPSALQPQVAAIRALAQFHAAWDRLDYRAARTCVVPAPAVLSGSWSRFLPHDVTRQWVAALGEPLPTEPRKRAHQLRCLAVDLLANGERRLRDQHFEDALLRAYRVLELIGQFRLLDHGLLSEDLPHDDSRIRDFQSDAFNRGWLLRGDRRGRLTATRESAARLLLHLKDPMAHTLLAIADEGAVSTTARNVSVLIHGFEAQAGSDAAPLESIYRKLEMTLIQDSPGEAARRLCIARVLDFTRTAS